MSAKRTKMVAARESRSKKRPTLEQQVKVEDLPVGEATKRGVKGGSAAGRQLLKDLIKDL